MLGPWIAKKPERKGSRETICLEADAASIERMLIERFYGEDARHIIHAEAGPGALADLSENLGRHK